MNDNKHTPTPWRIEPTQGEPYTEGPEDLRLVGADNISPAIIFGGFPTIPGIDGNAAFIVRAVNSFDAMREALDTAQRALRKLTPKAYPSMTQSDYNGREEVEKAYKKIRAAAVLADGEG